MKTKINKILIFLIIALITANFLFTLNPIKAADNLLTDEQLKAKADPKIQELQNRISENQKKLEDLQKRQSIYEETIQQKKNQVNTLKNQVNILDDTIAKMTIEIQTTQLEISQTQLEIENTQINIQNKEAEIQEQQNQMAEVLRVINKKHRNSSNLEILVTEGSLGNFLDEVNKLQSLENTLTDVLGQFRDLKKDLETKQANLETREKELNNLRDKLLGQQEGLNQDKEVKLLIIDQTKGQEYNYQELLKQAKNEQNQIESDIESLEVEARKKVAENQGILPSDEQFIWPVSSRTITAYFHDPDYPFRYVYEHPAIDIGNTPQGSPVRAARSGYVARVKWDGTTSYAYIMLVHTGGLSTVYGHISKPMIQEDTFVVQGQTIGLSGAMPGSVGAGRLTTGPHLHFEVRLNGIPVDPLNYLP
jgi:murein DD-endopeptidase MepM/ murein hydrolase activator NlpD